jgi:hypothetical protein
MLERRTRPGPAATAVARHAPAGVRSRWLRWLVGLAGAARTLGGG